MLATFTVTSSVDHDPGSLRRVMALANANPGTDTIEFAPGLADSLLDGGGITVTDSVIVQGPNVPGGHSISADGGPGIFSIFGPGPGPGPELHVTLRDLTLEDSLDDPINSSSLGQIDSVNADLTLERVTVQNSIVTGLETARPRALLATGRDIQISIKDSTFIGNGGGAQLANRNSIQIYAEGDSSIAIEDSIITGSVAGTSGLRTYLTGESELTIANLEVTDNSYGGAYIFLRDESSATISGSTFSDNNDGYEDGAGLSVNSGYFGEVRINDSIISGNNAGGFRFVGRRGAKTYLDGLQVLDNRRLNFGFAGMDLRLADDSVTEMSRIVVDGNEADQRGGGISMFVVGNASLELHQATITNNMFDGKGALDITAFSSASIEVSDSVIAGNTSQGLDGAGVSVSLADSSSLEIVNSTISGNTTRGFGGGIHVYPGGGTLDIHHSTIANNTATVAGGGLHFRSGPGTVASVTNSIIASNVTFTMQQPDISSAYLSTASHNLIGNGSGGNILNQVMGNIVGTDAVPVDPGLASLADNGGPTLTHALLSSSPAINAGDPSFAAPPQFDQRGEPFRRVANARIDIGAFESQTPLTCDFDADYNCDGADIDALHSILVNGPADALAFDLTGDGIVTIADRDEWLILAGAENLTSGNAYLLADANLDGAVDGEDFLVWNDNKFTNNFHWTDGDFNADGFVNGQDFVIWNDHKFTSADRHSSRPVHIAKPNRPNRTNENRDERVRERARCEALFDTVFAAAEL